MHLTTRTRYGLRALIEMGRKFNEGTLSIKELATCQNLSAKYLEQIFMPLKAAGIVKSIRGSKGGYRLARPPEDIKLHEIVTVLEGSIAPVDCVENPNMCPLHTECSAHDLWREINNSIYHILSTSTLGDLVKRQLAKEGKKSA